MIPLHVCPACGAVNGDCAAALKARDEVIESLREDVALLERDLRSKRAQYARQRRLQDAAMRANPAYERAMEVLEAWRDQVSPNARELAGKRLENVLARLAGTYTKRDLLRCIEGYALKPYVVNGRRSAQGGRSDWRADAELIFRDPMHVDAGIRIADEADALRNVLKAEPTRVAPAKTNLTENGLAALRYAEHGWFVLPVAENGKTPVTPNGLSDAKRDLDIIERFWAEHPNHNVAIRTGACSGVVVLDVDTADGGGEDGFDSLMRLEDEHDELPETACVKTPRGGEHYYFQHPGVEIRNTVGYPRLGLDIRGDGGYVLVPPSVVNGRSYAVDSEGVAVAPMPGWLVDLLVNRQRQLDDVLTGGFDVAKALQEGIRAGQRHNTLTRIVGKLFSLGLRAADAYELIALANLACRPPVDDKELRQIVKSIAKAEARKVRA